MHLLGLEHRRGSLLPDISEFNLNTSLGMSKRSRIPGKISDLNQMLPPKPRGTCQGADKPYMNL